MAQAITTSPRTLATLRCTSPSLVMRSIAPIAGGILCGRRALRPMAATNMSAPYRPQTVLITGATGGFGQAFARQFAALGCNLILTSRRTDELKKLAGTLSVPLHQAIVDVTKRDEIEKFVATLPADFQGVDCLINNAGGALGLEPAFESNLDDWLTMIHANVTGLVTLTHALLPRMVQAKRGHIINIGSVAGNYAYPNGHVYCAVKAFVGHFSAALRADLIAHNVRVTNIEPGLAETPFSLNRFKGDAERAAKVYEHANPLTADDIAEAVMWAATRPARVNINRIEVMPTTQATGPLAVYRG